jgi:hypothetical protein
MPGDDRRKLGRIQLERKLVSRNDAAPPSSVTGALDKVPPAPDSGIVPTVDLDHLVIATSHLEVLPRPAAEALAILPLQVRDDIVVVAMANPQDRRAIDEIEFATGKAVSPRAAAREGLMAAIAAAYDAAERGEPHYRAQRPVASHAVRARGK